MTASAIYEGWVSHRRLGRTPHSFRYRVFMPLFDLDELPELLDPIPLWSARRPAPARFHREDYLGGSSPRLAENARDLAERRVGRRPAGPVRLLANPRYLGFGFNPVSFFFLYGEGGDSVEAVIAEVTNTPWGERTAYVLDATSGGGGPIVGSFRKDMHVSPFEPMDQRYEISVTQPGADLAVRITSFEDGTPVFSAQLALRRREITRRAMAGLLLRYPPMTIATLARIYVQALRLWAKGAPRFRHPGGRSEQADGQGDDDRSDRPERAEAREEVLEGPVIVDALEEENADHVSHVDQQDPGRDQGPGDRDGGVVAVLAAGGRSPG
jgi:hypothetical protein